ncbi:MAG: hypothetical protein ABIR17_12115 [Pseudolysinimonas sp.]|uniref:hypothetical protein n=1 Tax=Pseudolysinimonas sp. TaxID=2680009 RepID=UPI00326713F6
MGRSRILASIFVLILGAATLSGCFFLPIPGPGGGSSPSALPISPGDGAETPTTTDPTIVVLTDDEVVPMPVFVRSTPAGTWQVGAGVPAGFPAGVPVFTNRWIKDNVLEFDSSGRPGYSALFWGGYDDVDQLVARLTQLGFDVDDRHDDTKRTVVADSERYRVVITATESAKNPGEDELLDPAYTLIVVVQD